MNSASKKVSQANLRLFSTVDQHVKRVTVYSIMDHLRDPLIALVTFGVSDQIAVQIRKSTTDQSATA